MMACRHVRRCVLVMAGAIFILNAALLAGARNVPVPPRKRGGGGGSSSGGSGGGSGSSGGGGGGSGSSGGDGVGNSGGGGGVGNSGGGGGGPKSGEPNILPQRDGGAGSSASDGRVRILSSNFHRPTGYHHHPPPPPPPPPPRYHHPPARPAVRRISVEKLPTEVKEIRGVAVSKECFLPTACSKCYSWCRLPDPPHGDPSQSYLTSDSATSLSASPDSFIQVRQQMPELREVTVTTWYRSPYYGLFISQPTGNIRGTLFSYYSNGQVLQLAVDGINFQLTLHGQTYPIAFPPLEDYELYLLVSSWMHVAVSYSAYDGSVCFYLNGQRLFSSTFQPSRSSFYTGSFSHEEYAGPPITPDGVLIIGQSVVGVESSGLVFEEGSGLVGCVYDLNVFSVKLGDAEINLMSNGCERLCGDVVTWSQQHLFDAIGKDIVAFPFKHRCCGVKQQGLVVTGSLEQ